jgi:hypothetical protein
MRNISKKPENIVKKSHFAVQVLCGGVTIVGASHITSIKFVM